MFADAFGAGEQNGIGQMAGSAQLPADPFIARQLTQTHSRIKLPERTMTMFILDTSFSGAAGRMLIQFIIPYFAPIHQPYFSQKEIFPCLLGYSERASFVSVERF